MAFPQSLSVTVATIADGSGTDYTANIRGRIIAVRYTKVDYDDGVDFTITTETSAQDVWVDTNVNASETVVPKLLNDGTNGTDLAAEYDHIRAFNERVKIVIAQGGNVKTGTFTIFYE